MTHKQSSEREEMSDIMRLGKGIHVKTLTEIKPFSKNHTQNTLEILRVANMGFIPMVPDTTQ